jgi:hypothetical protein
MAAIFTSLIFKVHLTILLIQQALLFTFSLVQASSLVSTLLFYLHQTQIYGRHENEGKDKVEKRKEQVAKK